MDMKQDAAIPRAKGGLEESLVGTWRLQSRIDLTASGERFDEPTLGSDPIALVFFDRGGNFAAQFMKRTVAPRRQPLRRLAVRTTRVPLAATTPISAPTALTRNKAS